MLGRIFLIQILLNLLSFGITAEDLCRTPGQHIGRCISIYECDYLLKILESKSMSQQAVNFLKLSQCNKNERGKFAHVCCSKNDPDGIADNMKNNSDNSAFGNLSKNQLHHRFGEETPKSNDSIEINEGHDKKYEKDQSCGIEKIENRIYSGQNTVDGEFPWLALMEYKKLSGEVSINCAGSLISSKHILTAAHCLIGDIIHRVGALFNVRLGDHDLSVNRHCAARNCGLPMRINQIQQVIPHEGFNYRSNNRIHDIGIIKLKTPVHYSAFVRPVCLSKQSSTLKTGELLYVVGFGRTLTAKSSTIKQKLSIPIFDFLQCKRKFKSKGVEVSSFQLCAGGEYLKDSCDGDSGTGLVKFNDNGWTIEGIVSFGYLCGLEGWPAIYTKVSAYIEWIEKHISS